MKKFLEYIDKEWELTTAICQEMIVQWISTNWNTFKEELKPRGFIMSMINACRVTDLDNPESVRKNSLTRAFTNPSKWKRQTKKNINGSIVRTFCQPVFWHYIIFTVIANPDGTTKIEHEVSGW